MGLEMDLVLVLQRCRPHGAIREPELYETSMENICSRRNFVGDFDAAYFILAGN